MTSRDPARVHHAGPNPGAVASIFMVLFLAGLVPVIASDTRFPSPLQSPEEIMAYFRAHAGRVAVCAFFQFGAAIPLGIYTATMTSRLRFHGVRVAGVDIALFGGFAAAFMTLVSALVQWVLARPGIATDGTLAQGLYYLVFATGGPGYSVPLGLLIAGISVPALIMRLLPRWVGVTGIVLAVIGELSALSLIVPSALFLIPLTRFPGFVWLIIAGFKLANSRMRVSATDPAPAVA
jgi:hypothetical protein